MIRHARLFWAAVVAVLIAGIATAAGASDSLELRLVTQTNSTITLGWTPQPGYGYLFSADGVLRSRTNDPNVSTVKFSKQYSTFEVAVIVKGATGTYPPPAPPPPPPPTATATVKQTIVAGSTIVNVNDWRAVFDANADGVEDDPGSIQFVVDGVQVLSEINAPFGDTFANGSIVVADGQHTFLVRAVSDAGTVLATNSVQATVAASSPPPPPPPTSGFPDASTTGVPAGTVLTPSAMSEIRTSGQVVSGIQASGCIDVYAPGVTIKNSRLRCIIVRDAAANPANPPLTVQDSEIVCPLGTWNTGILWDNYTVIRVDISGCENGLDASSNVTVRDSYIHDLAQGGTFHTDGIQGDPFANNVIDHNTIYGFTGTTNGTSAIIASGDNHGVNTLVQNNLMAGGAYTLYCPRGTAIPSFRVVGNHFSTIKGPKVGEFGPIDSCGGETLSGNVCHETGAPISATSPSDVCAGAAPPPPPPSTGFPDASNTGVPSGTTLAASGGMTISTAGTVISGRDITGQVVVNAANVTIRNSRIRTNAMWAVDNNSTGLVIEDSEILNRPVSGQNNCHNAIGDANFTLRRVEIAGCENGANIGGDNVTIVDTWIHDLDTVGPSYVFGNSPHTDGLQMSPGADNIVVRHNTIDPVPSGGGVTSAIIMGVNGSQNNVWVEDNILDGRGASYALYLPRQTSTNINVNRNRMGKGFGYTACAKLGVTVATFAGNVDLVTGAAVSPDNGSDGGCTN